MKKYPFQVQNIPSLIIILAIAFFAGHGLADVVEKTQRHYEEKSMQGQEESGAVLTFSGYHGDDSKIQMTTENWGLGFGTPGAKPTGNATIAEMKEYNAYYMAEGDEKIIYLTFDCGYENGNTEAILDALNKHSAHATFFVVGHYLESAPELVKRMLQDGHTVGNHTYHHPDMSKISDKGDFQKEMEDVRKLYQETTGEEMPMYYRPPQGKYNVQNLQMAKELGYSTFFWSLAYVDWNVDSQPSHEEALSKLTTRIHPGAIVLLHNTSRTNGEIMDELLKKWEEMGYTFGTLDEFVQ